MSLSSLFDISHPTDFLRSALNMLTEYEQAKEDNDRPKMVWLPSQSFFLPLCLICSCAAYVTFQRLWKWLPKRQTGMGDYSLGMPETSDTYLTIPHMASDHRLPRACIALTVRPSVKKKNSRSRLITPKLSFLYWTFSQHSTPSLQSYSGPRHSRTRRSTCLVSRRTPAYPTFSRIRRTCPPRTRRSGTSH